MATSNLLTYEWDKRKEVSNTKSHGVSFHVREGKPKSGLLVLTSAGQSALGEKK